MQENFANGGKLKVKKIMKYKEFLKEMIYWCIVLTCVIIYGLALGFFIIGGFILLCGGDIQSWTVIVGAIISVLGTSYLITNYVLRR